jgi:murein DD-endopeptidase MepM/ murein hydrolase activator NlpD
MADVLRWDLDFNRDLRSGDQFQVVYEEISLDGVRDRTGEVVGLAFWNRGRRLEAYRHGGGYYDGEGRPLQKMFLRSPLPFTRVTSRFSHRRFHPVLKTYRPHYGVDYGAPTGTPVRATANGVVQFAAWGKGSGRMVKIRHANDYLTAYLHLSKFGSGISPGRRVRQGDVIGYVGSTGLATAPHLDYRVQLRGKWIDPLSIKSVPADPISTDAMPAFLASRDALRERLSGEQPWVVPVDPDEDQLASSDSEAPSSGTSR